QCAGQVVSPATRRARHLSALFARVPLWGDINGLFALLIDNAAALVTVPLGTVTKIKRQPEHVVNRRAHSSPFLQERRMQCCESAREGRVARAWCRRWG